MEQLDTLRSYAVALPNLAKFAIVKPAIAGVPALGRRLRICTNRGGPRSN